MPGLEHKDTAGTLRTIERERLRSLVEKDSEVAEALHAPDFVLVNPSGGAWSREFYLGGIAAGIVNYYRFEPVSDLDVMTDGNLAIIRYRSAIDIQVRAQDRGTLECWHMDAYRRVDEDGPWQAVWSQATAIHA